MSISAIVEATELDRKTVIADLQWLQAGGWLRKTAQRRGQTRQIVVYEIMVDAIPDAEQLLFRNSSKRNRKSPLHGTGNQKDITHTKAAGGSGLWMDFPALEAAGLDERVWEAFRQMRSVQGKPLVPYAERALLTKLVAFARDGIGIRHLVERAIINGWTDFRIPTGLALPAGSKGRPKGSDVQAGQARPSFDEPPSLGRILREGKLGPLILPRH
jgi:hypothetical protein